MKDKCLWGVWQLCLVSESQTNGWKWDVSKMRLMRTIKQAATTHAHHSIWYACTGGQQHCDTVCLYCGKHSNMEERDVSQKSLSLSDCTSLHLCVLVSDVNEQMCAPSTALSFSSVSDTLYLSLMGSWRWCEIVASINAFDLYTLTATNTLTDISIMINCCFSWWHKWKINSYSFPILIKINHLSVQVLSKFLTSCHK